LLAAPRGGIRILAAGRGSFRSSRTARLVIATVAHLAGAFHVETVLVTRRAGDLHRVPDVVLQVIRVALK
jgi:hypothetical protein